MKIFHKSKVIGYFTHVYSGFDQTLFEYLLPSGAELIQFGGSNPGDLVEIQFNFPIKGKWVSEITETGVEDDHMFFIDVGTTLPFGLKTWHHKHVVKKVDEKHSIIEDRIEFSSGQRLLDLIYLPGLYLAFLPRVWQYKQYFRRLTQKYNS